MRISDWSSDVCSSDLAHHHVAHFAQLAPAAIELVGLGHIEAGPCADLPAVVVEQRGVRKGCRDMMPCLVAAHRSSALVGGRIDGCECRWSGHCCERRRQIGGSSEQPIIIDAIGCGDPGHVIALPHIILDRRVKKGVGYWAEGRYGIEEEEEGRASCRGRVWRELSI